jgi:hypothetical protein
MASAVIERHPDGSSSDPTDARMLARGTVPARVKDRDLDE